MVTASRLGGAFLEAVAFEPSVTARPYFGFIFWSGRASRFRRLVLLMPPRTLPRRGGTFCLPRNWRR